MSDECEDFPANLYLDAGEEHRFIYLDAYLNSRGLVTIRLAEDAWVEVSPLVAREYVNRLKSAVGEALQEMLSPTTKT